MRRSDVRQGLVTLLTILVDLAAINVSVLLAYGYRFHGSPVPIPGGEVPDLGPYIAALPVVDLVSLIAFVVNRMYRKRRGQPMLDELFAVVSSMGFAILLLLALAGLYRHFSYSRLVIFYVLLFAVVLVGLERVLIRLTVHALRRRGVGCERVMVVGTGSAAETLIQRMRMFPEHGYLVVGTVDDDPVRREVSGVPVLGGREDLPRLCRRHRVDEVFFAIPGTEPAALLHLIQICDDEALEFKIVPDVLELITTRVATDQVEGIPLIGVQRISLEGANAIIKRVGDVLLAAIFLVVALPLLALIGVLVRLSSSGPLLIRQDRLGAEGREFRLYKFRSMRSDAESESGPVFASTRDHRVTGVGRVLRRLSLDELPQLWNVLKGDMSLVGPRPERPHFVERFSQEIPRYVERHRVRPGLTGWAQVNDLRGNTSIDERTMYDLYYIENWSVAFDLKILITTFFRIFIHRHAY